MPFGFFAAGSLRRFRSAPVVAFATGAGLLLSFTMEWTQFYIAGRNAALSDVYSDTVGAFLGSILACVSHNFTGPVSVSLRRDRCALLLLVSWLGGRLFPMFPSLTFTVDLRCPYSPTSAGHDLTRFGVFAWSYKPACINWRR